MLFPCAEAFASFAGQKKRIEKEALQIATTIKDKIDYKYKILNHHNKIRILYRTEVIYTKEIYKVFLKDREPCRANLLRCVYEQIHPGK